MKLFTISVLGLAVMGCTPQSSLKQDVVMPDELSHCKMYEMNDSSGRNLYVVHCPDATTTTISGKHKKSVTVIGE
jgi:hypothetical protein